MAELTETPEGTFAIHSRGCPLAHVVRGHPKVCSAVQTTLSELLGVPVAENRNRTGHPRCEFEIKS